MEKLIPQIEAVIFASSEPVLKDRLIKEFNIEKKLLMQIFEYLKEKYSQDEFGIQIIEAAEGFQFVTKPQYHELLENFYGNRRLSKLSVPALETLAIIAYKQPVTRHEIEEIRGVNCDGVIKTLLDRDLIIKRGHSELPGKPSLYHTTRRFLDYFKITSLRELPRIDEFGEKVLQENIIDENEAE